MDAVSGLGENIVQQEEIAGDHLILCNADDSVAVVEMAGHRFILVWEMSTPDEELGDALRMLLFAGFRPGRVRGIDALALRYFAGEPGIAVLRNVVLANQVEHPVLGVLPVEWK